VQLRIRAHRLDVAADTRRERRVRLALGRHAAGIDPTQITLSAGSRGNARRLAIDQELARS